LPGGSKDKGRPADSFYPAVIVGLSFLALLASMGIRGSFGAYVTPWENFFGISRAEVSAVSFVSLFVYGLSMALAGRLTDRFGPRMVLSLSFLILGGCLVLSFFAASFWHILLLYGLIGSVGFGFASNITVSVAIVRWFREKKGLIISIVVLGMAAGPMIFTPLLLILIDRMGWKWTFLLIGLLYVCLLAPMYALFYRDHPEGGKMNADSQANGHAGREEAAAPAAGAFRKARRTRIFRHPLTWMIVASYFICGFTDIGFIQTHFIPLTEFRDISKLTTANVMFVYGIFNILGTVAVGYLVDRLNPKTLLLYLHGIRVAGLLLLYFLHAPEWLFVFAVMYALTDIATVAPYTMLCSKIYGEKQMGTSFGTISFFHQLGGGAGSLIPGILFVASSSYVPTLWVCLGLVLMNLLLLLKIDEGSIICDDSTKHDYES